MTEAGLSIRDLENLRDEFLNQALFIVGNGKSLTYDQLDAIQGFYSWGMNNITLAYPHTDWRPNFYSSVATTAKRLEHHKKCAEIGVAKAEHSFVWSRNIHLVIDNPHRIKGHAYILSCHHFPVWSTAPDREVSRYGNSIFPVFQIACYLGFREFYLIGCDMQYTPWDAEKGTYNPAHFCPNYSLGKPWNESTMRLDILRGFQAHSLGAIYVRMLGGEIWNCSSYTHIKTHPRISLKEALNAVESGAK